jgi:D-serine deaminase-like pyridoxal phosphate-dependent protein
VYIHDLPTPAVVIDLDVLEANLATMSAALPGSRLRPHVKAHKSSALARRQYDHGHHGFTCATPREVIGMAKVGLGDDLLLANEVVDPHRLRAMAEAQDEARITIAVDSEETVAAAAKAGLREVLVDVDIGLPRCGCRPGDAGRIADLARSRGLAVRGVMGYEGHLMMVDDPERKRTEVESAVDLLLRAHADVGGDVVSSGGTGTYHLHDRVTEVQAGSYALMDTAYSTLPTPFRQALTIVGTVISVSPQWAVCDVGLKALGMDHGDPRIEGATVWFCSDEHTTFASEKGAAVGDRVRVLPAHVDPTMAMHDTAWVVRTDSVVDRWEIDLRGW